MPYYNLLKGIPSGYLKEKSEELQVVRYPESGRFKVHHDSSSFHPRLLTALFYLNDVGEGKEISAENLHVSGGTWFPFAREASRSGFKLSTEEVLQGVSCYIEVTLNIFFNTIQ